MSRTTFFGLLAASAQAVSLVGGLPSWAETVAHVLVAIALACLGYHAQDCPADCPNRKAPIITVLLLLASLGGIAWLCSGCTSFGMAQVVKALGTDTNSVSVHISTPWGSGDLRRNLPPPP